MFITKNYSLACKNNLSVLINFKHNLPIYIISLVMKISKNGSIQSEHFHFLEYFLGHTPKKKMKDQDEKILKQDEQNFKKSKLFCILCFFLIPNLLNTLLKFPTKTLPK